MKNRIICLGLLFAMAASAVAQNDENTYRRSSLYSLLINHAEQPFSEEIRTAYMRIPVPDKFNDHNLSVRVLMMDSKLAGAKSDRENATISDFLERNQIASRLVARWFNRDYYTGQCDMELIKERGLYNASEFDKQLASRSARGTAMLQDAGEELIGNTFVIVNDIRYFDKSKASSVLGSLASMSVNIAGAVAGVNVGQMDDLVDKAISNVKGFKVRINSFLYQLVWNDDVAARFYQEQYSATADAAKCTAFNQARGQYHLRYVGKVESKGNITTYVGDNQYDPIALVRKACQRAIDENVADLQRNYEEFRIKTPLVTTDPLTAYIGMKEGVAPGVKYEVLEVVEQEDGSHTYSRVGVIEPMKNLIWDNRYMAEEEGAEGASLGCTTFRKVSGRDFAKGMLIREMSR